VLTHIELIDLRTQAPFWSTSDLAVSLGIGAIVSLE
jgi:hypothetical protein